MNYTYEMIAKAKTATSASELQAMAKEYNIELSEAEAAEYYDFLNGNHKVNENGMLELSSVELEMVAGGKGKKKDPDPKYQVGQTVWVGYPSTKTFLKATILSQEFYSKEENGWRYMVVHDDGSKYNYYLESWGYVLTTDPKGKWPF